MSELGGIIHKMPITYVVYLVAIISMAGIPPMGGFISKWLIFQAVIDRGMIFVAIAVFFGSIGSFLYVFRPLAALFLGQELPRFKLTVKEAPILMLVPMIILTVLNIYTGVLPNTILRFTNKILIELNITPLVLGDYVITGYNGDLQPTLLAGVFGVGVGIAFLIFIVLKKSRKVGLMDTYTAGNFIYTEELMHYSLDFYAPLERLYGKYIDIMTNFYDSISRKVKELGRFVKYFFFTNKPEITVFWIIAILVFLLWGEVL
jgi:NADH-quinone oxidoreductase subunit M